MAGESEMETLGSRKRKQVVYGNPERPERLAADGEEEEEREIQKLEREVSDLARRILDERKANLDRVLEVLSSELLAKRPALPPGALIVPDAVESGTFSYGVLVPFNSRYFVFASLVDFVCAH